MSEGAGVIFDTHFPIDDGAIRRQIEHAMSLGLPEADARDLPRLTIIANGPTALEWPGWDMSTGETTLALNGALRLFVENGKAPDMWAACDPQGLVADFLTDAPESTTYYVASKCHPRVFEALRDRDVRLWHVKEPATPPGLRTCPTASSITATALMLFRQLGWRRFETWGWDACFIDGMDHASSQPMAPIDLKLVMLGEKGFHTIPAWALEADGAWKQIAMGDYEVEVHGRGLIAEMLRFQGITTDSSAVAA